MKKHSVFMLALTMVSTLLLLAPGFAWAADDDDDEGEEEEAVEDEEPADEAAEEGEAGERTRINLPLERKAKVVQKRVVDNGWPGRAELGLHFTLAPFDGLMSSIGGGGHVQWRVNDYFAFGINGNYFVNFDKDLKNTLKDLQVPDEFTDNAEPVANVDMRFYFYPVYGKFALMSSIIQHYDFGVFVGPSMMFTEDSSIFGATMGISGDIYFLDWLSLRLDFAYNPMVAEDDRLDPSTAEASTLGNQGVQGSKKGGTLLRHFYIMTIGPNFHLPAN